MRRIVKDYLEKPNADLLKRMTSEELRFIERQKSPPKVTKPKGKE